jgi:NADH pyrophosphatase NudC (nudix superfamily)
MTKKELRFCPYCGARFQEKFLQGRTRLVCSKCDEIYYENPLPAATALVINREKELLLGKRGVEPAKGSWCLPGGFIEMGESMEEAALRELNEETGLKGKILSFIDCFYQASPFYGSIIIFGYRVDSISGQLQAGDDMEELFFFDMYNLPQIAFESHRKLIEKLQDQLKRH